LGRYNALHDTPHIRLRLRRLLLRRWVIWDPVLKTRGLRLRGIRRDRVVVSVGEIWVICRTEVVCVLVGIILGARVEVLHGIGMLNSLVSGMALNSNVALEAI